ncbi:uncharacterized protein [Macaca fascicularis]|uniref:uncharacterized protein n=1 Tax=Macaca fascicularis TaxID=9541 RepID=UPI003D156F23
MLPTRRKRRRGSVVSKALERPQRATATGCFVQPEAQRARRERALRGIAEGTGLPRLRPPADPRALCRTGLRRRRVSLHSSAEGAPRPPPAGAESVGKTAARWRQKEERASASREGSHQAKAVGRALRGSSEPSGRTCQLPFSPRALAPNSIGARSSELENSLLPRLPQTLISLALRRLGLFPVLRPPALGKALKINLRESIGFPPRLITSSPS